MNGQIFHRLNKKHLAWSMEIPQSSDAKMFDMEPELTPSCTCSRTATSTCPRVLCMLALRGFNWRKILGRRSFVNNGNMLYEFQLMYSCLYLGKSDDALMIKPLFLAIPGIAENSRMFRPFEQNPLTRTVSGHPSMHLVGCKPGSWCFSSGSSCALCSCKIGFPERGRFWRGQAAWWLT